MPVSAVTPELEAPAAALGARHETNHRGDAEERARRDHGCPGQKNTDRREAPAGADPLLFVHGRRIVARRLRLEQCIRGDLGSIEEWLTRATARWHVNVFAPELPIDGRSRRCTENSAMSGCSDAPGRWIGESPATTVADRGLSGRGDGNERSEADRRSCALGGAGGVGRGWTRQRRSGQRPDSQGHRHTQLRSVGEGEVHPRAQQFVGNRESQGNGHPYRLYWVECRAPRSRAARSPGTLTGRAGRDLCRGSVFPERHLDRDLRRQARRTPRSSRRPFRPTRCNRSATADFEGQVSGAVTAGSFTQRRVVPGPSVDAGLALHRQVEGGGDQLLRRGLKTRAGRTGVAQWHLLCCSYVGEAGLEPAHPFGHRNLNPARLPIPPLARVTGQQ